MNGGIIRAVVKPKDSDTYKLLVQGTHGEARKRLWVEVGACDVQASQLIKWDIRGGRVFKRMLVGDVILDVFKRRDSFSIGAVEVLHAA